MAELKKGVYRVMTKRQCEDLNSAKKLAELETMMADSEKVIITLSKKARYRLSMLGKNMSDAVDLLLYVQDDEVKVLRKRRWLDRVASAQTRKDENV